MLLIQAVTVVLEEIDSLLRIRLKLDPRDTMAQIERQAALPLLSTQLEPIESKAAPPAQCESMAQVVTEPIDYTLKFGLSWSAFMKLSDQAFQKAMTDNLSTIGLDAKKSLILLRLRKNIDFVKIQTKEIADTKDRSPSKKKFIGEVSAITAIDSNFLTYILTQIQEANTLVKTARTLSQTELTSNFVYKLSIGKTEILLDKIEFFLKEHSAFCIEVDLKTKRAIGHPYALCDMLPSTIQKNDLLTKCHLEMHSYILQNLNEYSQYLADQKKKPGYLSKAYLNSWLYDPQLAIQKRQQVVQFFIDLACKTKDIQDPKSGEYEEVIFKCIDIHLGHASTLRPKGSCVLQKIEETYNKLHRELLASTSDIVRQNHNKECQASKLLK